MFRKRLKILLVLVLAIIVVSTFSFNSFASKKEVTSEKEKEEVIAEKKIVLTEEEIFKQLREANIDWRQAEGASLNIAASNNPQINTFKENGMYDLIEELTGIEISLNVIEERQERQKVTTDFLTHTGVFDLAMVDPMFLPMFNEANALVDLRPYLQDSTLTDKEWFDWENDFPEGWKALGEFEGKQYGIPMTFAGQFLFYNKKYFEQYGLDPSKPPETMEELEAAAKKLHHPEDNVYGIALRGLRGSGLNVFIWSSFMKAFGGEWFDENMKPQLDSPKVIHSIQYYSDLVKNYGPPGVSNWEWSKIMTAMTQGTIAMTVDTHAFMVVISDPDKSLTVGEWGFAPNPKGPAGRVVTPFAWLWGINSSSNNKKAAWLFIQAFLSKPMQFANRTSYAATSRLSILEHTYFKESAGSWYTEAIEAWIESAKYADPDARPRIVKWASVGDTVGAELESVIAGQKTAEEAAKDANKEIERILREAGTYD